MPVNIWKYLASGNLPLRWNNSFHTPSKLPSDVSLVTPKAGAKCLFISDAQRAHQVWQALSIYSKLRKQLPPVHEDHVYILIFHLIKAILLPLWIWKHWIFEGKDDYSILWTLIFKLLFSLRLSIKDAFISSAVSTLCFLSLLLWRKASPGYKRN